MVPQIGFEQHYSKQDMKSCIECNEIIQSNRRYLKCRKCIYKSTKILCSIDGCTNFKHYQSKVCKDCNSQVLEKNNSWKGGKTKHTKGYVQVRVGSKYIMQHRLIMENMIGRKLEKSEHVHHKNGIKYDNRPENLELWSSSHPIGCRVSDLIAWAEEILKKYKSF